MNNLLKTYAILLLVTLLIGCNSNDDDNSNHIDSVSHFKINDNSSYLTPNGYYSQYTLGNAQDRFILYFTDGEFVPIVPEEATPCPWVNNMNHGVTIWFKSNTNNSIEPGTYQYTSNENAAGVNTNSNAFYGFQSDGNCHSATDETLEITDGEMTISIDNDLYTITYSLISESGKEIKGEYYGELISHITPE